MASGSSYPSGTGGNAPHHRAPSSSSSAHWSPQRQYHQARPPSPSSVNNIPRSSAVPEIVIPRRSSSTISPSATPTAMSPPASSYSYTGSGLLRPPSQQAKMQQQQTSGASRYGGGHYSTYDASASSPAPVPEAPMASHEDSLGDVMGSSGVDLRAEEEAMQSQSRFGSQSHSQYSSGSYGSSSTARESHRAHASSQGSSSYYQQTPQSQQKRPSGGLFLEVYPLSMKVHSIAAMHGLGVEPDVLNYLSLTARTRFRNLAESMIAAARHRLWSTPHARPPPMFDRPEPIANGHSYHGDGQDEEPRPMYHEQLISDPSKQLSALEKVEREEEGRARRRRLARIEREAAEKAFLAALQEEGKTGGGNGSGVAGGSAHRSGPAAAALAPKGEGADGDTVMANGGDKGAGTPGVNGVGGGAKASKKNKAKGDGTEGPDGPKKKRQKKNTDGASAGAGVGGAGGASGAGGAGAGSEASTTGTRVSRKYNLSEDVQKRLTDSTATQLIGGKAYGWMTGAGAASGSSGKGKKKGAAADTAAEGGATGKKLPAPRFGSASAKRAAGDDDDDGGGRADTGSDRKGKSSPSVKQESRRRSDSTSHHHNHHDHKSSSHSHMGSVGAWGDVSARKAAKEEAERLRRLRVQMRDALFVLEEESGRIGGGMGRGMGGRALMKARAKMGAAAVVPHALGPGGASSSGGGGGGSGGQSQ
ncbi:hypothetical protein OC846_001644 [Tilletia horrida]|uniref:Transcription initiation factor TFIID subunit 4 n=1 Tax=Tilletia horrida TaxID=155126 RepID=A0AAN6JVR9_9BASI|nr:hypothetical protein OC846_001644 [Tilletia horrida]KAK0568581.1 hypothetical protein OC861_001829 [Tilletia horrida]